MPAAFRALPLALATLLVTGCAGAGSAVPGAAGSSVSLSARATLMLRVAVAESFPAAVTTIAVTTTSQQDGSSFETLAACTPTGCTVRAASPFDFVDVAVKLIGPGGETLETGTLLANVPADGRRTMDVAFGVTPQVYNFSVEPAQLVFGSGGTAKLSMVARDGHGAEIVGTSPLAQPVAISGATAAVRLAAAQFTALGQNIAIAYDGSVVHHVHFSGAAAGATVNGSTLFLVPASHLTAHGKGSGDARAPTLRRILTLPTAPPVPPPLGGRSASGRRVQQDLGPAFPPIGDQGTSLSCTAWSSTYAIRSYFAGVHLGWTFAGSGPGGINPDRVFSPAFAFAALDGGANTALDPSSVLGFLGQYGAVTWTQMPFDPNGFGPPPNATQIAEGAANPIFDLGTIGDSDLAGLKQWLDAGYPIWWIAAIDDNFEFLGPFQTWTGGGTSAGAHALAITGYDDANQRLIVRNSWGQSWGTSGVGYVSYAQWQAASILNVILSDQPSP
jgi:hypothetical protein